MPRPKKAKKAIRMTITLPPELKERMDGVGVSTNWSAVAAEAFQAHIRELAAHQEVRSMDDVIERLKAADEVASNEDHDAGREAGEAWVREKATPKQLRRLRARGENWRSSGYDWAGTIDTYANGLNQGIAVGLYQEIDKADPDQRRSELHAEAQEFWQQVLGDGGHEAIEDPDFARGFVEGALDLWEEYEGKLRS